MLAPPPDDPLEVDVVIVVASVRPDGVNVPPEPIGEGLGVLAPPPDVPSEATAVDVVIVVASERLDGDNVPPEPISEGLSVPPNVSSEDANVVGDAVPAGDVVPADSTEDGDDGIKDSPDTSVTPGVGAGEELSSTGHIMVSAGKACIVGGQL